MGKLNKNLILLVLFLTLTGVAIVAYTSWTSQQKKKKTEHQNDQEWVLLKANPWSELEAISRIFVLYKPYTQEGLIRYKNVNGEVEEEKKFKLVCDSNIVLQTIDFLTIVQEKNYEAIVDHEQKQISITPGSDNALFSTAPQLGLTNLRQIFEKGNYSWEVYENGQGERMLYAPAFNNGTWTGLQIQYSVPGYTLKSVTMGVPKLVSVADEATGEPSDSTKQEDFNLDVLTEGLEISYQPLEKINKTNKATIYFNPDTTTPVLMDKKLVGYRIVNYNRNKR